MSAYTLTASAQNYAWRELARRAGCALQPGEATGFESLDLAVFYASPPPPGENHRPALYIVPTAAENWEQLLVLPPDSLDWLPAAGLLPPGAASPLTGKIPVLFWGVGYSPEQPAIELREDGALILRIDLLAAAYFMLARWEETVVTERDPFGRYAGRTSVAWRQHFLDRPVIDEYGLILRAWLQALLPEWHPDPGRFTVQLSHDVDHMTLTYMQRVRQFGGDLIRRRDLSLALRTLRYLLTPWANPFIRGLRLLVNHSVRYGLSSTFYFMAAAQRGQYDEGFDVSSPAVRAEIARIQDAKFAIGLHPSFDSLEQPHLVAEQKTRLEAVLANPVTDVRQHYLRIDIPRTWRMWEEAGFLLDSSLGYSDAEGFRAGTCWDYPLFDPERDCQLPVWERPLVVMDATLRAQPALNRSLARERILQLARRCKIVEGNFTLLWHNSSLWYSYHDWAGLYSQVLVELKALEDGTG